MEIPPATCVGRATTHWASSTTQCRTSSLTSASWEAFQDCDWVFDNNVEWVIARAMVHDTTDVSAEDTAPLGLGSGPLYQWWGPDHWFVSEQRSQAFASGIDLMACDTASEEDARIILNVYDKNISWNDCWVVGL